MTTSRTADGAATILEIRYRAAIAGWIFIAIWMAILIAFTFVLHRDGPHPTQPAELQYGAIALFWLVGIPVAGHLWAQPCTRFSVAADGSLTIASRSVFGCGAEIFPPGTIARVETRPAKDDDGDPIFRTVVVASDGRERLAREGRDLAAEAELAAQLRAALRCGAPAPGPSA